MPSFATSYVPPGIYTNENPIITQQASASVAPAVAIIGPSIGFRTYAEQTSVSGVLDRRLTKLGILTGSVIVRSTTGTVYSAATDYTLTVGAGDDANAGVTPDNTLDIRRQSGGAIPATANLFVTYNYVDVDFFQPQSLSAYADVRDAYGDAFDAQGALRSPISLAAKLAFDNGATEVICCAAEGQGTTTRARLAAALAKLASNERASVIVPIMAGVASSSDQVGVATDVKTHCDSISNDGLYRIGVCGFDKIVTEPPTTSLSSFASPRLVLTWPYRILVFNETTGVNIEVGGYYLAAAAAGRLVSNGVQVPLTRKTIAGINGIVNDVLVTMSPSLKNSYSSGGVTVMERTTDNRFVIRHGVSTDTTTINSREISLTRSKDQLLTRLRTTFERSGLIGSAIDQMMAVRVKALAQGVLETSVQAIEIVGYDSLGVRQNPNDPTVIDVSFRYRPAYPLNYVYITYSINPTTGDTLVA